MSIAESVSELSSAKRLQVGCVAVKNDKIISFGYNGTPADWNNECEYIDDQNQLVTKPEVIHAEMNCLMKLARSTESSEGAVLFITHAPCMHCSKAIYQAGIHHVFYKNVYRTCDGVDFLKQTSTIIEQYDGD